MCSVGETLSNNGSHGMSRGGVPPYYGVSIAAAGRSNIIVVSI